jgi:hypothetical protein
MLPPFPGMDPRLEGHVWPDMHHDLATRIKEQIVPQVIPKYTVRIETYTVGWKPHKGLGVPLLNTYLCVFSNHPLHADHAHPLGPRLRLRQRRS